MMLIGDDELPGYLLRQSDGYVQMSGTDPYRLLIAAEYRDGEWRMVPTDLPVPWAMGGRRFATPAEALTALVPFAAAGESEREMLAIIAATTFEEPR